MKRLILTSMLTVAGLMAQSTGAQSGSAPTAKGSDANSNTTQNTKKHRHVKKTHKGKTPADAVQPNAAAAPSSASPAPAPAPVKK